MKKYFSAIALGLSVLALAACNGDSEPTASNDGSNAVITYEARKSTGTVNESTGRPDDIQDGTILHAWNWSYNTIKDNMAQIALSGYTAIQTSPVQQCKSTVKVGGWNSEWYMLYQPVALSIAEDSYLGTKEELKAMCSEAEKYGIKVIVDIVSNHLGNNNKGEAGSVADAVEQYEPEIWNNKSKYIHQYGRSVSDNDAKSVTQGSLSDLPDLNTSEEHVQNRVISLLKECIDCGVDGFRFDAAKHIETPDDGSVKSNYWPNVLNSATKYAKDTYGTSLYYYGEILNTVGTGRNYSSYTKYMSITDNAYSNTMLKGIGAGTSKYFLGTLGYKFSNNGTKAVVWAESHDTFADGSTSTYAQERMNRVYAFEAARGGAVPLYFARPNVDTAMGQMGAKAWKSAEISAVNNFRNDMVGKNETISYQPNYLVVERGKEGAVIITAMEAKGSKDITLKAYALADGTYYDQVTGKEVTVSNGQIKGKLDSCGIMVIEKKTPKIAPEVVLSAESGYFYESFTVNLKVKNFTTASYKVNNGEEVTFTEETQIELKPDSDGIATLVVNADNNGISTSETYTYKQIAKRDGYVAISGLKDTVNNKYVAWVWYGSQEGHWEEVKIEGAVAYIAIPKDKDGNPDLFNAKYLIAAFPKDYDVASLYGTKTDAWNNKTGQTSDYDMREDFVEVSTI